MATNTVKARIQLKNDTEANWLKAAGFIPFYDILTTKTHKIYAGIITISSVAVGAMNTTLTYTNMGTTDCAVVVTPIGSSNAILRNLCYSVSNITASSARLYLYNNGSSALTNVQLSYIVMAKI